MPLQANARHSSLQHCERLRIVVHSTRMLPLTCLRSQSHGVVSCQCYAHCSMPGLMHGAVTPVVQRRCTWCETLRLRCSYWLLAPM